jgi:hypothetical protein
MKTIEVSISKNRIVINGESQKPNNFIESGLCPNGEMVTDRDEIEEYFSEQYEDEEITFIFED